MDEQAAESASLQHRQPLATQAAEFEATTAGLQTQSNAASTQLNVVSAQLSSTSAARYDLSINNADLELWSQVLQLQAVIDKHEADQPAATSIPAALQLEEVIPPTDPTSINPVSTPDVHLDVALIQSPASSDDPPVEPLTLSTSAKQINSTRTPAPHGVLLAHLGVQKKSNASRKKVQVPPRA